MKLNDLIAQRSSVRHYLPNKIEAEKLAYVLEAAHLAPSAVNYQPWCFIIVQEEEGCKKIHSCYGRPWIQSAPMYIIACANHSESWKRAEDNKDHADIDVSIAVEHICLAATEQGLGTCWVCNFDLKACKEAFNLPEEIEPVVIIPIGYPDPAHDMNPKKRKPLEAIIKYERY